MTTESRSGSKKQMKMTRKCCCGRTRKPVMAKDACPCPAMA